MEIEAWIILKSEAFLLGLAFEATFSWTGCLSPQSIPPPRALQHLFLWCSTYRSLITALFHIYFLSIINPRQWPLETLWLGRHRIQMNHPQPQDLPVLVISLFQYRVSEARCCVRKEPLRKLWLPDCLRVRTPSIKRQRSQWALWQ